MTEPIILNEDVTYTKRVSIIDVKAEDKTYQFIRVIENDVEYDVYENDATARNQETEEWFASLDDEEQDKITELIRNYKKPN